MTLHPISQIIERNLHHHKPCDEALWINPEKDPVWSDAAKSCSSFKLFCQHHGAYTYHQNAGADVEFSAFPAKPERGYQWIILNLPRQKALLRMLLDCAAGLLADGGVVWLAGENKAGIKSAGKILTSLFSSVSKLDNARHCTLYEVQSPLTGNTFNALDYQERWLLNFSGSDIKVASYPGVFAHGRLDAGTALLLETLSELHFIGEILDFGCGAGVIGASIATQHEDVNVSFLDASALALRACEETLSANQLSGTTIASDGLEQVDGSYDMVISNPPIHAGVKTDNQLSVRLLESIHRHISPGGRLILVANRHLPYENWLSKKFLQVKEIAGNKNFKVLAADL